MGALVERQPIHNVALNSINPRVEWIVQRLLQKGQLRVWQHDYK